MTPISLCVQQTSTAETDQYWSDVVLLLSMDGTEGSTTFVDSSSKNHTITVVGAAAIDTSRKMFGTGSLITPSDGSYLSLPTSTDWEFGTSDFTIEGWFYSTASGSMAGALLLWNEETARHLGLYTANIQSYGLTYYLGNASQFTTAAGTTNNAWHHIALVRYSDTVKIYIDGVADAGSDSVSGTSIGKDTLNTIGGVASQATYSWPGNMDEIRITKGIARYTTDFTPRTSAFPTQ